MRAEALHRLSRWAVIGLPLFALALVAFALVYPPVRETDGDEGTMAHVFQLSILALGPAGLAYLATADWSRPRRAVPPIAISFVLVVAAFVTLYALEHPR